MGSIPLHSSGAALAQAQAALASLQAQAAASDHLSSLHSGSAA